MDIGQIEEKLGRIVESYGFRAAWMATTIIFKRSDVAMNMPLPLTNVDVLLESLLWFRRGVTKVSRT